MGSHLSFSLHLVLFITLWFSRSHSQNVTDSSLSCVTESASLNTNSEISLAVGAFQVEAISSMQDFISACNLFSRRCYKNLTTLSSAEELSSVCVSQGGQVVAQDIRLKCEGSYQGVPIPGGFSIVADDFPACLGKSCDPENLPDDVTSVYSTVSDQAKTEITNVLGDGITCQDSAGNQYFVSTYILAWSGMIALIFI
jgi:hypothetical protein